MSADRSEAASPEGPTPPPAEIHLRRWLLWAIIPAVLAVSAFGIFLRLAVHGPTPLDLTWLHLVGLHGQGPAYWLCVGLAIVGGGLGQSILSAVLIGILALLKRVRAAATLATTMLLGVGMSELLKHLFDRLRPTDQLYSSTGWSYPSGHSMGAAAIAFALVLIATRASMSKKSALTEPPLVAPGQPSPHLRMGFHWTLFPAVAWILLMMWSRTALQVHWLTDTIAGALVGLIAAIAADAIWTIIAARTRSPLLVR